VAVFGFNWITFAQTFSAETSLYVLLMLVMYHNDAYKHYKDNPVIQSLHPFVLTIEISLPEAIAKMVTLFTFNLFLSMAGTIQMGFQ